MKKFLTWVSMGVFLFAGVYASITMARMPRTYDGAAAAIVQQNLDRTHAVNDVTSIVFDFRGYDTMGEAFILITAVAGSSVIIYNGIKEKKEGGSDGKEE